MSELSSFWIISILEKKVASRFRKAFAESGS
jgi:hypothetical protein